MGRAALKQHQLDSILTPERPTAEIVAFSREFVGRPIATWSREPEIARTINDRLSRTVHVRLA